MPDPDTTQPLTSNDMLEKLVLISESCPEHYHAVYDGRQVASLHLRHGFFSVTMPDELGREVYRAQPDGDAFFSSEEERSRHLGLAIVAIKSAMEADRDA